MYSTFCNVHSMYSTDESMIYEVNQNVTLYIVEFNKSNYNYLMTVEELGSKQMD